MKKLIAFTLALALAIPALPQTKKYVKSMAGAIELMNQATAKEEFQQCIKQFEELADVDFDSDIPITEKKVKDNKKTPQQRGFYGHWIPGRRTAPARG